MDGSGTWHSFPWNLPKLTEKEGKLAIRYAKDWKRIHTLAEELYRDFRLIYLRMVLCQETRNEDHRKAADDLLKSVAPRIARFEEKISGLAKPVREAQCIRVLTKLNSCGPAIKRSLTYEPDSSDFADGTVFIECACTWLLETLTRADRVLEVYFHRRTART